MMKVNKRNWTVSIIYFVVVLLTLVLRIAFSLGLGELVPFDGGYLFTIIVQLIIFGAVPFTMFILSEWQFSNGMLKPIQSLAWRFGFTKKVSLKNCGRTLAITILMIFTATFLSWIWQMFLSAAGFVQSSATTQYTSVGVLFLELFMVGVLPAVFEEFTHRGLLFAGFRTNNLKDGWRVVLLSALMFSLMHQNIRQTGYTFYDGLIMGLLCYYTGSIYPSIFAHFVNNACSVLSEYMEQVGALNVFDVAYDWLMSSFVGYLVFLIAFIGAVALLCLLFYGMRKDFLREQNEIRQKRKAYYLGEADEATADKMPKTKADFQLKIEAELERQTDGASFIDDTSTTDGASANDIANGGATNFSSTIDGGSETVQNGVAIAPEKLSVINQNSNENKSDALSVNGKVKGKKIGFKFRELITELTLPNDYSKDFAPRDKKRRAVFVYLTYAVGVICAVLSLTWGLLK